MTKRLNLIGQRFGKLIVLDFSHIHKNNTKWLCQCDCGNETVVFGSALINGVTKSCGCLIKERNGKYNFKDLTNLRFGRLLVIKRVSNRIQPSGQEKTMWLCLCDCGKETTSQTQSLISGDSSSCGCLRRENIKLSIFQDLTGKVFGKLTVSHLDSENDLSGTKWICQCECGNILSVFYSNLKRGNTKSCGCMDKESYIASELKNYFTENYNAKKEKKLLKNPDTKYWFRCDIYIPYGENPDLNGFYIEVHGEQHYKINGRHKQQSERSGKTPEEEFEYQKQKDKLKKKYCKKNGHYIEVNLLKIKTVDDAIDYIEKQIKKIIGEK